MDGDFYREYFFLGNGHFHVADCPKRKEAAIKKTYVSKNPVAFLARPKDSGPVSGAGSNIRF